MKKCLVITDYIGESINSTPYVRVEVLSEKYETYLALRKNANYVKLKNDVRVEKYEYKELDRCIKENSIDFIYVQGIHNYFFAYRLASKNKKKLVIDIFDHIELSRKLIKTQPGIKGKIKYWGYNVFYFLGKLCIKKADIVFVTLNEKILDKYPKRKYGYIHLTNGIHREIVKNVVIENKSEEQIHFVYVGYVREDRGIYKIFNAVKEVTDRGYNIYMDIIGPIDENEKEKIMNKYAEFHLENNLTLHGFKQYDEVKAFLSRADYAIYFFPIEPVELKYIYPIKLLEYMSYRLPTIATAGEGIKEIANCFGKTIVLCEYDSNDLIDKIEMVINNNLKSECNDDDFYIKEEFYWENINNRFIEKIEEIV